MTDNAYRPAVVEQERNGFGIMREVTDKVNVKDSSFVFDLSNVVVYGVDVGFASPPAAETSGALGKSAKDGTRAS